jgi:hypothetical protein
MHQPADELWAEQGDVTRGQVGGIDATLQCPESCRQPPERTEAFHIIPNESYLRWQCWHFLLRRGNDDYRLDGLP